VIVAGNRLVRHLDALSRRGAEPVTRWSSLDHPGRADAAQREAVTIGLLPYEVALLGAAARENGRGHVGPAVERHRDACDHPARRASCALDRLVDALGERAGDCGRHDQAL
jgi:hypothetical protein